MEISNIPQLGPGCYNIKDRFIPQTFNKNENPSISKVISINLILFIFKKTLRNNFKMTKSATNSKLGPGSYEYDYTRIKMKKFYDVKIK